MSLPAHEVSDTRTRILEATAECIADDGIAAVRMATIAKAAGVSTALLHYHFATKEHLFESVLRYSYESTTVLDEDSLRGSGRPPAERLAAYLDRCLPSDDELARDWLLWQELGLMCLRQPELAAVNADLYQGDHERVAAIIRDGVAEGSFRECDADAVAQAAVALCDGLGNRVLVRRPAHDAGRRPPHRGDHRRRARRRRRPPAAARSDHPQGHQADLVRPHPRSSAMSTPHIDRRDFLRGALGLGATAALAGCGFAGGDAASTTSSAAAASTAPAAKAKIDGDLVYFNWADYLDPEVMKGFQKEYGVKIIESNFDSMRGRCWPSSAPGNQYDVIFPGAKFVDQLRGAGQAAAHRQDAAGERRPGVRLRRLLRRPVVRPGSSDFSVPFTVYKTGHRLAQGQGRHDDRAPGRTSGTSRPRAASSPSTTRTRRWAWPRCVLGYDVNTAKPDELDADQGPAAQPEAAAARLLLRRHQEHGQRRRLDPPHVERRLPLPRSATRSTSRRSTTSSAPKEGTPINSDAYAIPTNAASTPAPRCCSSTTCCGPRTRSRTSTTSATRCR